MGRIPHFMILFLACWTIACQPEEHIAPTFYGELMEVPQGFPSVPYPEDNAFNLERWELGKKLFYDPVLSLDTSISCASCHKQSLGFADDVAFSPGVKDRPGTRNAPSLANVAYHPYYTREGGLPSLEMQVLVPIQEHNEFDFNIVWIAERLAQDSLYTAMAASAYGREPDPFVITRALACFERSLISGFSRYDQYVQYQVEDALSDAEIRGMDLFFSDRTGCAACHGGFNFTEYAFENNGLYDDYPDSGRFRLTGLESDRALFKVPSLRNVALTAPYMHDGSLASLEEVLDHYISGGSPHPNKSSLVRPLDLKEEEKQELILFLASLTDEGFIHNELFSEN